MDINGKLQNEIKDPSPNQEHPDPFKIQHRVIIESTESLEEHGVIAGVVEGDPMRAKHEAGVEHHGEHGVMTGVVEGDPASAEHEAKVEHHGEDSGGSLDRVTVAVTGMAGP